MRQNAVERPKNTSDIVPRTFWAHFCHFLEVQIWVHFWKFLQKCDFEASRQTTYVVQKWRSDTHLKPLLKRYQMCVQSPFLHNICFQTRGRKIAFLHLSGGTRAKSKISKSAIFLNDFGLKFFAKFWKKNAIFWVIPGGGKFQKWSLEKPKQAFWALFEHK